MQKKWQEQPISVYLTAESAFLLFCHGNAVEVFLGHIGVHKGFKPAANQRFHARFFFPTNVDHFSIHFGLVRLAKILESQFYSHFLQSIESRADF